MVIINDNVITISDTNGEKSFIIPESFKSIGAQFDENSIRINFKLPKIVGDNINLAKMIIKIKYINAGGKKGQYIVEDVNEENEYITFSWVLSGLVTRDSGVVKFNVCAVSVNDNGDVIAEWNTAISEFGILKGIDIHSPSITPAEKDIISQTISICQNSADEAALSAQQAQEEAEKVLNYGPKIGENGNWLVGGEDTGQPSQGFSPAVQIKPIDNGTEVAITDKNGEKSFEVKDGKDGKDGQDGAPGTPGKNGADGKTPVRGVDYWTNEDKKEIVNDAAKSIPIANDTTQGIVKAKPVLAQEGLSPVSILPDGTLLHETTKPGELLLAEYIHQGNQEIYFSSFDWSTGIGECTEPHGLTKTTMIMIVPNDWWKMDIRQTGRSIPIEWCLYWDTLWASIVDENHLKVVGGATVATANEEIPIDTEDIANNTLNCTDWHFEVGVPFEITNFPVKPTSIRTTISGFVTGGRAYRYLSIPIKAGDDTDIRSVYNKLLYVPTFGAVSKPHHAIFQSFDMVANLIGTGYIPFYIKSYHAGRRANKSNALQEYGVENTINLCFDGLNQFFSHDGFKYIYSLKCSSAWPVYSNHSVVKVYARAVTQ